MNDQQENRLSRAGKVEAFLQQHTTDLKATPAITATLQPQLSAAIEKMRADDEQAVADNTGYAEGKGDDEISLENLTDHIGSALESYADDADDFVLQNSVEFTLSQIQGFRDNRLIQYAQYVLDTASSEAIKPVLVAEHNITEEDLNRLKDLIKKYTGEAALPQQKRGEASAWGKLVDRDLADIDVTLNKLRRKMNTYRYTNRFLFDAFTAVDNVDDTGSHKASEETVGAGETKSALSFTYNAAATIGFENTGVTTLQFTLYNKGAAAGTPLQVLKGNTIAVKVSDISPAGDEWRVTNLSDASAGSYIIHS